MAEKLLIDLTLGKNALFVRQTIAFAFGIPLDREFTWESLRDLICVPGDPRIPARIQVDGLACFSAHAADEAKKFMSFLSELKSARPDIEIKIRIH